jgi:radical SAM superfamily enzyme YgiQ (UPF0313 family)
VHVLLISTYELGHQPLHVASPAAALRRAGHTVEALDLAVEDWDADRVARADRIALSVPMHTAARLSQEVLARLAHERPDVAVAAYGLYAPVLAADGLSARLGGEYEPGLLEWAADDEGPADGSGGVRVHLGRSDFARPARDLLPPLERYARLAVGDELRVVGHTEATHGCTERCRHCPVPAVYDGRTRALPVDLVLADVAQQVAMGARHVTFGDPDFLSGPAHARRVVDGFAERFPGVTFDVTTKVEHILRHEALLPVLAAAGCLFVVTAVESLDDAILTILDKGHTAADAARAVALLRRHGLDPHPTFLPFTPWTTEDGVRDIVRFVGDHDLVEVTQPVQLSLRLLLPPGSLLLDRPELAPHLDGYDPATCTWRWRSAVPAVDVLQADLARLAGAGASLDVLAERCGVTLAPVAATAAARPRLTEPWFCCAEPTDSQLGVLRR